MNNPALEDALWQLLESEAHAKYYLWKKDIMQYASRPAIIVCAGIGLAPDHKKGDSYSVYFGAGIHHWSAKNLKQAKSKAEEVLRHYSGKVKMVDKYGREYRIDLVPSINTKSNGERKNQPGFC